MIGSDYVLEALNIYHTTDVSNSWSAKQKSSATAKVESWKVLRNFDPKQFSIILVTKNSRAE